MVKIVGSSPQAAPPKPALLNSTTPAIVGDYFTGDLHYVDVGDWNTPCIFSYIWVDVDGSGNETQIPNGTREAFLPTSLDVGFYIATYVTATNANGIFTTVRTATSPQKVSVSSSASTPSNTAAPTISGTAQQGQVLTSTSGSWVGGPTPTYGYQWQTSANGTTGWANLTGAGGPTTATYTVQAGDVGNYLRCVVTATNSITFATANSAPTTQITASGATWTQADLSVTNAISGMVRGYSVSRFSGSPNAPTLVVLPYADTTITQQNTPGTATDWAFAHFNRTGWNIETAAQAAGWTILYVAGQTLGRSSFSWLDSYAISNQTTYYGSMPAGSNQLTVYTDKPGTIAATGVFANGAQIVIGTTGGGPGVQGARAIVKVQSSSGNVYTVKNLDNSAYTSTVACATTASTAMIVNQCDYPDTVYLQDVINYAVAQGWSDSSQVYLQGGSAGGEWLTRMHGDAGWNGVLASLCAGVVIASTKCTLAASPTTLPDNTVFSPPVVAGWKPYTAPPTNIPVVIMHGTNDTTCWYGPDNTPNTVSPPGPPDYGMGNTNETPEMYYMGTEGYRDGLIALLGCTSPLTPVIHGSLSRWTLTGATNPSGGGVMHMKAAEFGHVVSMTNPFSNGSFADNYDPWPDIFTFLQANNA